MFTKIVRFTVVVGAVLFLHSATSFADPIGDVGAPAPVAPAAMASPVILTAAASHNDGPLFVQLYNNSDTIQDMRGWRLMYSAHDSLNEVDVELATFNAWIVPRGYEVVAATGKVSDADYSFTLSPDVVAQLPLLASRSFRLEAPTAVLLAPATFASTVSWPQWQERNKNTAGKYLETFTAKTGFVQLLGMGRYIPPETTDGLRIVEILANARDCSPLETSLDCGDYVKLYNSSTEPVDLAAFRLRTDSGGSKSSSTNTVKLAGILQPGVHITIHLRDSGDELSITNDGGFVWLEDAYGVRVYEPVLSYPDATNSQGASWAYNGATNAWQGMMPAPDMPNYWPPAPEPTVVVATVAITTELTDCGPGRERNPETNRCRTIVSAETTTGLAACPAGQERNLDTNRCRSTALASAATLAACAEGQERNPDTNRCRSILTAASTQLAACPAGQERNPDTNRCRKTSVVESAATTLVKDIEATERPSVTSWFVASGALIAAVGYAIYEWRSEILRRARVLSRRAPRGT